MPGSLGDGHAWRFSSFRESLENGDIFQLPPDYDNKVAGQSINPYVVADCAFPLTTTCMKCYEKEAPSHDEFSFNWAVIRTRRVVECAFGRLKGRFQLIRNSRLSDPKFAGEVFMVCAALHNFVERAGTPPQGRQQMQVHEPTTQDVDVSYVHTCDNNRGQAEATSAMRSHLSRHIASQLKLTPVTYEAATEYPTILHGPVVPAEQLI